MTLTLSKHGRRSTRLLGKGKKDRNQIRIVKKVPVPPLLQTDHLLGMLLWSLTKEKKEELFKKAEDKKEELNAIQKKTASDLWRDELDIFMTALDEVDKKEQEDEPVGIIGGRIATRSK